MKIEYYEMSVNILKLAIVH